MSRTFSPYLALLLCALLCGQLAYAQSSCDPSTPSFTVDLSSNPDSVWVSPNVSRDGHCCSVSGSDRCIEFVLTLHPDAVGISFEWYSGAQPPGHEYQINCGTPVPLGDVACLSGPGPHYLTYCKPGGNANQYAITSVKGVKTDSLEVGIGCDNYLKVSGLLDTTIQWNSIFPGAYGDHNNLLSCSTNCDSTVISPVSGSPTEIHYQVMGISSSICGGSDTLIDTAVVMIYPDFEISLSDTLIACTQTADITLNINGGKAPFNILWNTGETSQTINVNQDGDYTVRVLDSLGCITLFDTIFVDVESIPQLNPGVVSQPTSSQPKGSISVSGTSGLPPYSFVWSHGPTTKTVSNLDPGTYEVVMTDQNGCKDSASYLIRAVPFVLDSVIPEYQCANGLYNFTVYVTGGVNPISYSADNGNTYQTSNTFTNYSAGTYLIKVRDNAGTLDSTTLSLSAITPLVIDSLVSNNPSCGNNNGSVTVFATGTPPLTYQLDGGAWLSSNSFSGLGPGTHTVKVRDSLNCEVSQNFSLSNEAAPVISIAGLTNPSCASADGAIAVSATGVARPFSYAIRKAGGSISAYTSDTLFNNLSSGIYTLYVTDANGCIDSVSTNLTEVNDLIISSIQSNKPGCNQSNGNIIIFASGGSGPKSYSIDGGNSFQSSNTFNNLPAGLYTIVVRDSVGCSRSQLYPLDEPNGPQIDLVESTNANCAADNGTIKINSSGGKTPLAFSIDGGQNYSTNSIYSNLPAGTYFLEVKDADSCVARDTVTIADLPVPSFIQVDVVPASCSNIGGSLSITASGTNPIIYSINGGVSYSTSNSFSPLAPGNYSVWIQDSTGCTHDTIVNIPNQQLGQVASITGTNEVCGRDNGSILVHLSGDATNSNFSIDGGQNYQSDSLFSNLSAGSYQIVVLDSSGCSDTLVYTLSETPGPSIDAIITQDATCGNDNGSATANISSGTAPYQYSWAGSSFGTSNSFGPATAGTYTLLVRDANGCLSSQSFTIGTTPALAWNNIQLVDATCDLNNGSIVINLQQGTSPYSYSIDGGTTSQSNGTFNNLGPGSYNIQVSDASGCALDSTVSLQQLSSPIIDSANSVPPFCGQSNGEIHFYANGNGSLVYQLNGASAQANGSYINLGPGNYTLTATDSNGCEVDTNISLSAIGAPTIDSVQTTDLTCGLDNGSLQVFANLGTRPYEFSIDGINFQVDSVFSNLAAGTYNVTVRDDSNCTFTSSVTLQVQTPPSLSLTSIQNPSCAGNDGSFSLAVADGLAPFEYSINGAAFSSTSSYSGMAAGAYTAVVRDANGCRDTLQFDLVQPGNLAWINVSSTDAYCNQNDGTISVNLTGGTPGYDFSLDGSAFNSQNSFSNLAAGTYNIRGRDSRGCIVDTNISIQQFAAPVIDSVVVVEDICGRNQGSITIYGSPQPLSYGIDNTFGANNSFTNLAGGNTYLLSLLDTNGCRVDTSIDLGQVNGPSIDSVIVANATCDSANGSLVIYVTGPAPPFSYSIDGGGTYSLDSLFSPIGPGNYDISVIDSNGCESTTQVFISAEPAPFIDTVYLLPVRCEGNNGSAGISIVAGEAPFEYSIDGMSTFVSDSLFSPLSAGTYTVHIRDVRGCLDSVVFTIDSIPPPTWDNPKAVDATCNQDNGAVYLTSIKGSQPFEYFIDGVSNGNDSSFTNLSPGTYNFSIVDSFGCSLDTTFTLGQLGVPAWTNIDVQGETCGAMDAYIHLFVTGNGPLTYSLDGGAPQLSNEFNNLSQGYYHVLVSDTNGCTIDTNIRVFTIDGPVLDSVHVDSSFCGTNNGRVEIFATGGALPHRYVVSGDTGSSNIIDTLSHGWHHIEILDANDCPRLDSIFIDSIPKARLQVLATGLADCNKNNGWVKLGTIGGSPNYQYQVDGNGFSSNDSIVNLGFGNHTAYLLDAKGCLDSVLFSIDSVAMLVIDRLTLTDAICGLDNGSIRLGVQGGEAPFAYSINAGSTYSATPVFTGLPAGTYPIKIIDNLGCEIDSIVVLQQLDNPIWNSIAMQLERCDMGNGVITASATGNGNILYNINGGFFQPSGTFTGLSAGTYVIGIRDSNFCELDSTVVLLEEQGVSISVTGFTEPRCGLDNGSIRVNGTGGGGSPEFKIDTGAYQSTGAFANLAAGTYRLYARDAWGCVDSIDYTLNARPSPLIDTLISSYNCGSNTYDLDIQVISTNGGLNYSVDGGANMQSSNQFAGLSPGTYHVYVTDGLACVVDSMYTLGAVPLLAIDSIQFDPPSCSRLDGSIRVFASGAGPFVYSLDGTNYDSSGFYRPLGPGSYTVYVRDSIGCVLTQGINLSNSPGPQISIDAIQNPNCGRADGFIEVSANGAASPFLFALDSTGGALNYLDTNRFDSLKGGNYTLWAIDSNGCESSQSIFLFEVNNMVINSITSTSPGCGQANGSLQVQGSGGTPPLTYSIDSGATFQSSGTFNNLIAGSYDIIVQDVNGCDRYQQFTINEPNPPAVDLIETDPKQCGFTNGEIRIFASGGSNPYQYSIDGGNSFSNTSVFSNLDSGTYFIQVLDNRQCLVYDTAFVGALMPPVWDTLYSIPESCSAVLGEIHIGFTGLSPMLYSINNGLSYQTDSAFRNVVAGTYQVSVLDSAGCRLDTTITVADLNLAYIDSVNTAPEICDAQNGWIQVYASADTSLVTYSLDGGVTFQPTSFFGNLDSGNYNLVISHPSGCSDNQVVRVAFIVPPTINAVATTSTFCTQNNGTALIQTSGGVGALSFSLDQVSWQPDSNFINLAVGSYVAYVQDANGCLDSIGFSIQGINQIRIDSLVLRNPTCDALNGQISLFGVMGTRPYQYSIDGGLSFSSDSIFIGLDSGVYALQIMDAQGCTTDSIIRLERLGNPVIFSSRSAPEICDRDNGRLSVTAFGNGQLEYRLDQQAWTTDTVFVGLDSGNYNLSIRDSNLCVVDTLLRVEYLSAPSLDSILVTDATCREDNGIIDIYVSGMQAPFNYSIDSGLTFQPLSQFTSLSGGQYLIVVQDSNLCEVSGSAFIDTIPMPVLDSVQVTAATCDQNNGVVILVPRSGQAPYEFSFNNAVYQSSNTFNGIPPGDYLGFVRDVNGCIDSLPFTVDSITPPRFLAAEVTPSTCGTSNGSLALHAIGGSQAFSFSIDNGVSFSPDSVYNNLTAGTYFIELIDQIGCVLRDTVVINDLSAPSLTATTLDSSTCENANGSLVLHALGNGPFQYSIDGGFSFQSDSVFNQLEAGTYNLMVIDTNGCVTNISEDLHADYSLPVALDINPPGTGCMPYLTRFSIESAVQLDSCRWDLGDGTIVYDCTPFTHEYQQVGCYAVNLFVRTTEGCYQDSTFFNQACVIGIPKADFEANPHAQVNSFDPIQVFNQSIDADSVNWYLNNELVSRAWEPIIRLNTQGLPEEYQLCLEVFNQSGCKDTICTTLRTATEFHWFIANAFTPNMDGINEGFKPVFYNMPQQPYSFRIYNRWGEIVFRTSDPNEAWDGHFEARPGDKPKQDVYGWRISFINPATGELVDEKGKVTLLY